MGGKKTKRERKFQSSGGIQGRLNKGTFAKKGKLRKRKKRSSEEDGEPIAKKPAIDEPDRSDDFIENVGNLDLESFFTQFTEKMEHGLQEEKEDDESPSEEEDSDEDETSSDNSDSKQKPETAKNKSGKKLETSDDSDFSSSEDDSDDDDVDAAQARMKKDMAKLQRDDPEFHSFLQKNEKSLLEFGDEEESHDEDTDNEEEVDSRKEKQKQVETDAVQLTAKGLQALERGTFQSHGISSLKKLVAAYKSACHLGGTAQDEGGKKKPGESGKSFIIDSSQVFDQLMMLCLKRCCEAFHYHLLGHDDASEEKQEGGKGDLVDNKPLNPRILESSSQWSTMRPILSSFFRSTLHLMSEAKEPEQLALILDALSKYIRFLTPFPRLAESMLTSLISLWSAPIDAENYQVVRLKSFVRIRQLALTQPFPFIEECLKKCYLAYARCAKLGGTGSVASALPTLTFMGNCLVELYSLDYHSSYQHAFVYIRQLALLLRSAIQKKTAEAFQQVYCWQYIFCLKLWVAVLAAAVPQTDGALMSSLIYPLTEIILGVTRSGPSPTRHLPLRFHCIRLLQQLAAASETYIPTTLLLLDALRLKEWHLKPKKSRSGDARGLQMNQMIKLPNVDCLRTHEQLEAGMIELFALLNREIELYRYSAGFPEFSIQIVQSLKTFSKETRNPRWKSFARGCLDTSERYSSIAVQARSKLREAPKDIQRLECLRPATEPTMRERHDALVEKERKLWEAARPIPAKTNKVDSDDDDEDATEGEGEDVQKPKKKRKKTKKSQMQVGVAVSDADLPGLMAQADEVQEGIDWSDDD